MIIAIIAGGSGTRLWPLSTPDYPKHLLRINGDGRSLLQQTYDRAINITDKIYIISEKGQMEHVHQQLPELSQDKFIVEPDRRGTANCIVAALVQISKQNNDKEPIAFVHADHYIRNGEGFTNSFRIADQATVKANKIVLVGIEPTVPATGFGYIEKGEPLAGQDQVYQVKSFKEKPDQATAEQYLKSGNYLWNGGFFVASLATFLASMKQHAPDLVEHFNKLKAASEAEYEPVYLSFEPIAIDYALIEKVPDLLMVPATFDWMDLGSFNDLQKAVSSDDNGNHIYGKKVETEAVNNSYIYSTEDKPVAVIGLEDVAVVNTPNGLLVTRKDQAQKVGEVSKRFKK